MSPWKQAGPLATGNIGHNRSQLTRSRSCQPLLVLHKCKSPGYDVFISNRNILTLFPWRLSAIKYADVTWVVVSINSCCYDSPGERGQLYSWALLIYLFWITKFISSYNKENIYLYSYLKLSFLKTDDLNNQYFHFHKISIIINKVK